jgi:hypothetical protein
MRRAVLTPWCAPRLFHAAEQRVPIANMHSIVWLMLPAVDGVMRMRWCVLRAVDCFAHSLLQVVTTAK